MADSPPIPEAIWRRVRAFLDSGASGQLVLHVAHGEVVGLDANEMIRLSRERDRVTT